MLGEAPRRISQTELERILSSSPPFRVGWLQQAELDKVCTTYTALTGARVVSGAKRQMIAAAYRTVGPEFFTLVAARFAATGTETNLLAALRGGWTLEPLAASASVDRIPRPHHRQAEDSLDCGCDEARLIPGLVYCADHHPRFDPSSNHRHDRRASNPDAARFFPTMASGS